MTVFSPARHTTFEVERVLATSPRHAFRFWSDPVLKAKWNDCHLDWVVLEDVFEFRPGGNETKSWRRLDGSELAFRARYFDIVPERRIIYGYEMSLGGVRLSVSLATINFAAAGDGTRVTFIEQAALLTGDEEARGQRILGTEQGLDRLVEMVGSAEIGAQLH
jgi:uncharacterized protein YndB with AHSA1/START domain